MQTKRNREKHLPPNPLYCIIVGEVQAPKKNEYHLNRHQPDKPQFAIQDLSDYVTKNQEHFNSMWMSSFCYFYR